MKVYIDEKDIGTTITYKEENGKKEYIYCHDREGFVFKDLADYTKQVRKELIDKLALFLIGTFSKDAEFTVEEILNWFQEVKDQMQELEKGETECQKK